MERPCGPALAKPGPGGLRSEQMRMGRSASASAREARCSGQEAHVVVGRLLTGQGPRIRRSVCEVLGRGVDRVGDNCESARYRRNVVEMGWYQCNQCYSLAVCQFIGRAVASLLAAGLRWLNRECCAADGSDFEI
jgi:hypothetical protein